MSAMQLSNTPARPRKLPPRVYAVAGMPVFAWTPAGYMVHAAIAPPIERYGAVARQSCWKRTLCGRWARLTAEPYRDLWPDTRESCARCWRAWERRYGAGEDAAI